MVVGNYNSEYESYYSKILRKKNDANIYSGYMPNGGYNEKALGTDFKLNGEYFLKRFIRDLIGVAVLFVLILSFKIIPVPQAALAYNYSKTLVNTSYDYKSMYSKIVSLDVEALKQKVEDNIETLKSKMLGKDTIKETISKDFVVPTKGTITSPFGKREDPITKKEAFHHGIDIEVKENTEIKSAYKGKVKEIGEEEVMGKYIIIDHGQGIETKYGHLSESSLKKEQEVETGEVIGKSGNTGKSTAPHLHFEIMYMGQSKDPLDYMSLEAFKN